VMQGGLSSNVEKLPPDRKDKEPVKSKDEKGLVVLSKTLKKPETVGAKVAPKASNVWISLHSLLCSCSSLSLEWLLTILRLLQASQLGHY